MSQEPHFFSSPAELIINGEVFNVELESISWPLLPAALADVLQPLTSISCTVAIETSDLERARLEHMFKVLAIDDLRRTFGGSFPSLDNFTRAIVNAGEAPHLKTREQIRADIQAAFDELKRPMLTSCWGNPAKLQPVVLATNRDGVPVKQRFAGKHNQLLDRWGRVK